MKQRTPLPVKMQKKETEVQFKPEPVKTNKPPQQVTKKVLMKEDPKRESNTFNNVKKTPLGSSNNQFDETKMKVIKKEVQKTQAVRPPSMRKLPNTSTNEDLNPCDTCGRTFNQVALEKHSKICKKVFVNKRKEFNSAKQRLVSKEQVTLKKKAAITKGKQIKEINGKQVPLWKQQSMALRVAMKQVRGVQSQEDVEMMKSAKQMAELSMVKCKFCGRSFNDSAAVKHVPFCEKKHKQQVIQKPIRK